MTKVIGIIEDNCITGVKYGEIEIADTPSPDGDPMQAASVAYRQAAELQKLRTTKTRKNNTKHK